MENKISSIGIILSCIVLTLYITRELTKAEKNREIEKIIADKKEIVEITNKIRNEFYLRDSIQYQLILSHKSSIDSLLNKNKTIERNLQNRAAIEKELIDKYNKLNN